MESDEELWVAARSLDEDAVAQLKHLNRRERELFEKREHWQADLNRGAMLVELLNDQLDKVQEMICEIKKSGKALAKGA